MTAGVKETKEIVKFVVALGNFLATNAGKSPVVLALQIPALLNLLQLIPAAIGGVHKAVSEAADGFSPEEKAQLYAEVDLLKWPNATIENVVEAGLKAALGLGDLITAIRGELAA
jgi:ABC-type proline/glycine betaine transport system permease subunit